MSTKTTALAYSTYAIQSGEMWAMPWKNNGLHKTKTPLSSLLFLNYRNAVKINWEVQIHGTFISLPASRPVSPSCQSQGPLTRITHCQVVADNSVVWCRKKKVTANTPRYPITSNSRFNGGFNCSSSSWITSRGTFNYCRSVWIATRVLVGSQEF